MNACTFFSAFFRKIVLPENRKKVLFSAMILLLAAGTLVRAGVMGRMEGHFLHNDGGDYLDISRQLAEGNGFSSSMIHWYEPTPEGYKGEPRTAYHRPPLLPLLGAVLYFLPFPLLLSAKIAVLLMSAGCILMVFLLAKEVTESGKTAFLAACFYTFYPYSIYHGICYSSENLFLFLTCGAFYFLSRCIRKDFSPRYAALCGGMTALATLTRPQGFGFFLLLGFLGTVLMLFRGKWRKKLFLSLICYTAGAFLLLAPWMVRNFLAAGRPTPLTFYGAYSFALASSDISFDTFRYLDTPLYKEKTDRTWNEFHEEKRNFLAKKGIYNLPAAEPYWKQWAWEYIRKHPDRMLYIVWNRLLHCFRIVPNTAFTSGTVQFLLRIYCIPLFLLFLAGIFFQRKNVRAMLLLTAPLCVLLFALPFLMLLRFRYPFFAPEVSIFAACGAVALADRLRSRLKGQKEKGLPPERASEESPS